MNNTLIKEHTRIILGSIGFVPPPNLGKSGLSIDSYLTNRQIQLQSEDGEYSTCLIWAGESNNYNLNILVTSIITDDYCEFNAVYQFGLNPIHCVKTSYYDNDEIPNIILYKLDNKWKPLGTYNQLLSCAQFVRISDLGIEFSPVKEISDELYKALVEVVQL